MKKSNFIMWMCIAMVAVAALSSCSADAIAQDPVINMEKHVNSNTFRVVWTSNQKGAYVEFAKHVFKDCKIQSSVLETHRENRFEITLETGQKFDLQIKKDESVKDPELYLAIYKGNELQYEQEVNTGGFMMSNYVDHNGNIGK